MFPVVFSAFGLHGGAWSVSTISGLTGALGVPNCPPASLRIHLSKFSGGKQWSNRLTVVLANSDLIDRLRVAVLHSITFGAPIVGSLGSCFASLRSRAALQFEILALCHQLGVL